ELCDVALLVGSRQIHAHRAVLAASSPYFRAMFTGELAESRSARGALRDMDELAVESLVEFCYTAHIIVEESNASEPFADTHACRELLKVRERFAQYNFVDVTESEEFLLLPVNQLIDMIGSDELNAAQRRAGLSGCDAWVRHSLPERRQHLPLVLSHVRLPQMSPKFLVNTVRTCSSRGSEPCRDLVDEAKNYLLLPPGTPSYAGPSDSTKEAATLRRSSVCRRRLCSGDAINTVERFDPTHSGGEWRLAQPVVCRRGPNQLLSHICRCRLLDGAMFAVGGQDARLVFELRVWGWVAVLDGILYAVGGSDGQQPLQTVERYDPRANRWMQVASMTTPRKHLGVAVFNNCIYSVGGRDDTTELSSAECFDPKMNCWRPVVAMTSRRSGVGLAVVNNQLMAIGGFDGSTYLKTVEIFDADCNCWKSFGSMNSRRLAAVLASCVWLDCTSRQC
uniref:BTB domain-containing protein n=1 Tax=Macrostomum lignano TaxID=282301 RepID=A0A1I8FH93_9PLAT